MANHATMAGAGLELAGQDGHLRLEPCSRLTRRGIPARRFGEPLMRQRQGEMIRNAPGEVDILVGKTSRIPREEEERSEHIAAERDRNAKRGACPHCSQQPAANRFGGNLAVDVVDDIRVAVEQNTIVRCQQCRRPERLIGHLRAGHRIDAERQTIFGPRGQREHVVGERVPDDIRHLREDLADVQRFGDGVEQADQRVDPFAAA